MKIFLSFLQSAHQYNVPAYSFWEYYIKKGIEEAGHEWIECDTADWAYGINNEDNDVFAKWKLTTWQNTLHFLKRNRVDLFLSYLFPHQVDTESITEIRRSGIPCVNFFCDNIREFKRIPKAFSVFDLNWVPEFKAIDMYKKEGYNYIHLPMPMWVAPKHRTLNKIEIDRISFIGSHDIQRQLLFEGILKRLPEFQLDIYGVGWLPANDSVKKDLKGMSFLQKLFLQPKFIAQHGLSGFIRKIQQRKFISGPGATLLQHLKGKPDFDSYIKIIQQSMITIGVNRYPSFDHPLYKPDTYSRLRDIEAPMLGACYLTEYTSGLEKMYELDRDIVVYKSEEEFICQVNRIKQNKELRMLLRVNGQRKALNELSIPNSLKEIKHRLNILT